MKKEVEMKDFDISVKGDLAYIKWENLENVMGKRMYKQFMKFMRGQTCIEDGAYPWDVKNFLRPEKERFFD